MSQKEQIIKDRKKDWDETREEVDRLTDGRGYEMDEEIKNIVIALRVFGFPTRQSCAGHYRADDKKCGATYPWVDITHPEPDGWNGSEDREKIIKDISVRNMMERQRLLVLLEEFYQDRKTDYNVVIGLEECGWKRFYLKCHGAETMGMISPEMQVLKRTLYRKEFNEFAEFLKSKFLSGGDVTPDISWNPLLEEEGYM